MLFTKATKSRLQSVKHRLDVLTAEAHKLKMMSFRKSVDDVEHFLLQHPFRVSEARHIESMGRMRELRKSVSATSSVSIR